MPFTHVGLKTVNVSPQWAGAHNYQWVMSGDGNGSWVTATAQTDSNGNVTDVWDFTVQDNSSGQRTATCTVLHNNGVTSDSFTITQIAGSSSPAATTSTSTTTSTTTTTTTTEPPITYTNLTIIGGAGGTSADESSNSAQRRITFTITGANIPDGTEIGIQQFIRILPSPASTGVDDWLLSASSMLDNNATGIIEAAELNPFVFSNNSAELDLEAAIDYTTEGDETFQLTLESNTSGASVQAHGLGPTFQFSINDTSTYAPIALYNNSTVQPGLLGSPVATTSGSYSLTTYTWDNETNPQGPAQSIMFDGTTSSTFDIAGDMTIATGVSSSLVNTPGGIYWSNSADGSTDDTAAIAFTVGTGTVHDFQLFTANANNGVNTGDGTIQWEDGATPFTGTPSGPPAGPSL